MKDIVGYCMLMGALSSASVLPFWTISNQFRLMPESSGALVAVGANRRFDELYVSMKFRKFPFVLDLGKIT